jgi:hypothetical protein
VQSPPIDTCLPLLPIRGPGKSVDRGGGEGERPRSPNLFPLVHLDRPLSQPVFYLSQFANMAATNDVDEVDVSSLSLNDASKVCIVEGIDTALDTDMPFVNRHEELWQMFHVNAGNFVKIFGHDSLSIDNFRRYNLLFCVQYFGAGKTTLGKVFPDKVKEDDVMATFNAKLGADRDLESEWQIIQDKGS